MSLYLLILIQSLERVAIRPHIEVELLTVVHPIVKEPMAMVVSIGMAMIKPVKFIEVVAT